MYEVLNVIHVVGLQEPLKGVGEAIEEEGGGIANQGGGGGVKIDEKVTLPVDAK